MKLKATRKYCYSKSQKTPLFETKFKEQKKKQSGYQNSAWVGIKNCTTYKARLSMWYFETLSSQKHNCVIFKNDQRHLNSKTFIVKIKSVKKSVKYCQVPLIVLKSYFDFLLFWRIDYLQKTWWKWDFQSPKQFIVKYRKQLFSRYFVLFEIISIIYN